MYVCMHARHYIYICICLVSWKRKIEIYIYIYVNICYDMLKVFDLEYGIMRQKKFW
jgi:hypothetical protein